MGFVNSWDYAEKALSGGLLRETEEGLDAKLLSKLPLRVPQDLELGCCSKV